MELELKEYPYKDKKISFTLEEKQINGLSGSHIEDIIEIIRLNGKRKDHIKINHKEIKEKDICEIKKKIAYIQEIPVESKSLTIKEEMIEYIKQQETYPKNLKKKLKDSLKIVGLEETILERNYATLSSSEQKMVQVAKELLCNPELIILEEPFKRLDMKSKKDFIRVLRKIKDQNNRTIVIVSDDPEVLYQDTEHLIIIKNEKVLLEEKTQEAYQRVDFLKKHKVEIPEIIEFTYLAKKKKNVKIDYFRDIRDIIKDIYKHV